MFASSLWACWMLMWTFGSHLSSITTVDSQSCFWTRFMDFVYDWWFKRYRWRYWEYSSCIGKKRSKTLRHNTIIVFSVAFSDNPTNSDYMSNIYSGSGTRSVLTFCPRGTTKASNTMMNAGFFLFSQSQQDFDDGVSSQSIPPAVCFPPQIDFFSDRRGPKAVFPALSHTVFFPHLHHFTSPLHALAFTLTVLFMLYHISKSLSSPALWIFSSN